RFSPPDMNGRDGTSRKIGRGGVPRGKETRAMVRSIWKGTLLTALSWAGFAWAEPKLSPLPASSPYNAATLTVCEPGMPEQQCEILKAWKDAHGRQNYQVRSLQTGEIMTIVDGPDNFKGSRSAP